MNPVLGSMVTTLPSSRLSYRWGLSNADFKLIRKKRGVKAGKELPGWKAIKNSAVVCPDRIKPLGST
jgi:hypothetical protein